MGVPGYKQPTASAQGYSGLVNADGRPLGPIGGSPTNDNFFGGDDGGGPMKFTASDLRKNVAQLNGLALIFTTELLGGFAWMIVRIDDRFDRVQEPLQSVAQSVAAQGVTIAAINDQIDRISDKVDNAPQPQASPRAGQAGSVHQGTPPKP